MTDVVPRAPSRLGFTPAVVAILALLCQASAGWSQARQTVSLRGHTLTVYRYGPPSGDPVVVSSGDGGWLHLGPQVAALLGAQGYSVVGVDVKAYLAAFTTSDSTLGITDVPGDYRLLLQLANPSSQRRSLLVGVSEGAALSVLAATDPRIKPLVRGVIGLGLPDRAELGWRWRDSLIYLTHKSPNEPSFSVAAVIGQLAPLPVAAIHSTRDEFVPVEDIQRILAAAGEPKRLWLVRASDHRFSDNRTEFEQRLRDAIAFVEQSGP